MVRPHAMSSYEARRATFAKAESTSARATGASRRAASHARQPSWPHPLPDMASSSSRAKTFPSPGEMANYGLYFAPPASSSDKDACVLYPEEHVVIGGWSAGDNVADRIRQVEPRAAFLLIIESKESLQSPSPSSSDWTVSSADLLPTSKAMNDARARTFGNSWPYDGKKGWKPTSKKLAQAGFHYTPNEDEDDCATCQYCDVSLGGWEKTDDPVHEHQRRRPECAFFNCKLEQIVASTSSSKAKSAGGHKRTRSASSKRKVTGVAEEEGQVGDAATAVVQNQATEEEKPTRQEASSATASNAVFPPTRTSSRKKAKVDEVESIALAEEEHIPRDGKAEVILGAVEEETHAPNSTIPNNESQAKLKPGSEQQSKAERRLTQETIKQQPSTNSDKEPEDIVAGQTILEPAKVDDEIAAANTAPTKNPSPQIDSADRRLSSKGRQHGPAVVPMSTLPEVTKEDEDMTVEAWLKIHVRQACDEMEREGMRRIECLREEMKHSRVEIEAILRGQRSATLSPLSAIPQAAQI